jgi:hypothetical protein
MKYIVFALLFVGHVIGSEITVQNYSGSPVTNDSSVYPVGVTRIFVEGSTTWTGVFGTTNFTVVDGDNLFFDLGTATIAPSRSSWGWFYKGFVFYVIVWGIGTSACLTKRLLRSGNISV